MLAPRDGLSQEFWMACPESRLVLSSFQGLSKFWMACPDSRLVLSSFQGESPFPSKDNAWALTESGHYTKATWKHLQKSYPKWSLIDLGPPLNYLETFPPSTAKYLMLIHLHVIESCEAFRVAPQDRWGIILLINQWLINNYRAAAGLWTPGSAHLCSVHGYARVHPSIYIYIYILLCVICTPATSSSLPPASNIWHHWQHLNPNYNVALKCMWKSTIKPTSHPYPRKTTCGLSFVLHST
jgi:hypothetical protein